MSRLTIVLSKHTQGNQESSCSSTYDWCSRCSSHIATLRCSTSVDGPVFAAFPAPVAALSIEVMTVVSPLDEVARSLVVAAPALEAAPTPPVMTDVTSSVSVSTSPSSSVLMKVFV